MNPVMIFKALGHETRYRLFCDLFGTSSSACEIKDNVPACCVMDLMEKYPLSQSTISHHLKILVEAELVEQENYGTYHYYRVNLATWNAFRDYLNRLNLSCGTPLCPPQGRI
ncbi:ArsR family transcriptional regulator [Sulfobacillus thermosulfidooxidans DSM 9293]|uniref:ArsR family transcriptional regulator n=1 Tax=Sulfobacillus thermosulfidooxidans (strain DSM 9293 / VKM B-1269 / AT-1) TaxID=929705 RepID=A0A1W1WEJ4_SULTA|nr:metalloregulator ArsR/SmtB family transcription factor [Sulfobacillus thermosulfidooxidans]SMC04589.1 ArsR family transcriptional regulator [Sulfobacillus thermosulfidooxidans DSM 9293]